MPSAPFTIPVAKPTVLAPETNVWYWHPGRAGVRLAPAWFLDRLHEELGKELSATWNPVTERWQIWSASPKFQHALCQGWRLLFVHHDGRGGYLPLDERVFGRLYSASALLYGSARAYYEHITNEMVKDKAKREAQDHQDMIDQAMPYWDHSQIKVAMRGHSNGSKFSTYHAGL